MIMIVIEMVILWLAMILVVSTGGAVKGGDDRALPLLLVTITLIVMYVTLIRYTPVIKDCVALV